ncbi:MAG TPA: hypothetical protein VIY90_20625 [Steroidobacteraceae bacterium]
MDTLQPDENTIRTLHYPLADSLVAPEAAGQIRDQSIRVGGAITDPFTHVPGNVEPQHREKFISDVVAKIENLDASRIGGLGITREELAAWQQFR